MLRDFDTTTEVLLLAATTYAALWSSTVAVVPANSAEGTQAL